MDCQSPLCSILVPVYNCEAFIHQCLDSVVGQTYGNLQIVVVDDGSTDGSWAIMQEYAAHDSRVEIYHQENVGVATTRNRLLDLTKGEFLLFVDSDDWIELDMVSSLIAYALTNDTDVVECGSVVNDTKCDKSDNCIETWSQNEAINHFLHHKIFNGSLWTKMFRTKLIKGLRFRDDISYGEDALFCWYILQRVNIVLRIAQQYYHHRLNMSSISFQKYGPKMMSGHKVWEIIAHDAISNWPNYGDIASTSYAISDMWQLYYAAKSDYAPDVQIYIFQRNVRNKFWSIVKSGRLSINKLIFAAVVGINYAVCRYVLKDNSGK